MMMSLGYFLLAFMFNRYSALSFKYLNNWKLLMFYVKFDFKKLNLVNRKTVGTILLAKESNYGI